jgi:cytochrome c biogenesis protein CcmG/thiol:disulfide interchange protein DsbE
MDVSAAGAAFPPARRVAGRLQTIVVIGVTAIVIGAAAWVVAGPDAGGVTAVDLSGDVAGAAPTVGSVPPGFTATAYDGTTVSLADYAGRPIWLTFGASWCPDCRSEAPDVEAVYQRYKDRGLAVVGVFISESASDVSAYAGRAGLTFPIVPDPATAIASRYRTLGIPTHFFIGSDGHIKEMRIGALPKSEMDRAVAAIVP